MDVGVTPTPLAEPCSLFLKSLSISIFKIVHVRNTRAAFSCGFHFSSEIMYNVPAFGIYLYTSNSINLFKSALVPHSENPTLLFH